MVSRGPSGFPLPLPPPSPQLLCAPCFDHGLYFRVQLNLEYGLSFSLHGKDKQTLSLLVMTVMVWSGK